MRVIAISMVKNEIDIIEAFVRHNATLVSRMIVLDNGSTDGTADVLQKLRREGLPLDVVADDSIGKYQSEHLTRLMRDEAVGRYDAEWVLPLDGDEFLVSDSKYALLNAKEFDPNAVHATNWLTYVPDETDSPQERNPVLRMHHRLVRGTNMQKVLIPRKLARLCNGVLPAGSHEFFVGNELQTPIPAPGIRLAHFPIRSPGQYLAKIAVNSLQFRTMGGRNWESGSHYRQPFELLMRDPSAFLDSYRETARNYLNWWNPQADRTLAADPVHYRGGKLRYTPEYDDMQQGWLAVLHYAEDLARRHGACTTAKSNPIAEDPLSQSIETAARLRKICDRLATSLQDKNLMLADRVSELTAKERVIRELDTELQRLRASRRCRGLRRIGAILQRFRRARQQAA